MVYGEALSMYNDPMFTSLSFEHKRTILNQAIPQACMAISDMRDKASQDIEMHCDGDKTNVKRYKLPERLKEGDAVQYNIAVMQAHPDILKMVFILGFTQGYCALHRANSLNEAMSYFLDIDGENMPDGEPEKQEMTEDEMIEKEVDDFWKYMDKCEKYDDMAEAAKYADDDADEDEEELLED